MKILLCDDHRLLIDALAAVLTERGDSVTVTTDPEAAIRAARLEKPGVCVMDRMFPTGDDGLEAARGVRQVSPSTKVLMLTGHADVAGVRAAIEAGARGFLRKDEGLRTILEAVDKVAAGQLVVDSALLRPLPATGQPLASPLTPREREVLERMVRGESTKSMAEAMDVSYSTARTHTQNLLSKLGVHSQVQAAAFAVRHGLVRAEPDLAHWAQRGLRGCGA